MSKTIEINGKSVQLREPYRAPSAPLVGMENQMKAILAAWIVGKNRAPLSPLVLGEAGVGKNTVVYECARISGKELFMEQGREDLTDEDLCCTARISDNPDKKIDYILSNLGTALLVGGVYFSDGICKMRPRAQAPYESVLDDRRYIDSALLGERIVAHPGFRFIAATNLEDMEGNPPKDFIKSRLRPVIHFGYPEQKETEMIVKMHYPALSKNGTVLLDCFWDLWANSNGGNPPAPRDSLKIFNLAQNLADYELIEHRRPLVLEYNGTPSEIDKKHMEEAFEVFFNSHGRNKQCTPSR